MTERPLWLLDIDGVLNANKPGWSAAPRRGTAYARGQGWMMRWAPALMARIRPLHTSGAIEIRWASSWIGYTDQIARLMGLPDFEPAYPDPGLPTYAGHSPHPALKLGAAVDALAMGRRLIWTDDDAIPADWVARLDLGDSALLIAPRPNRGLQPDHLDAIEAFAGVGVTA